MIKEASDWVKFCVNEITEVSRNKVALDLACGSGRHSIFLSNKGYKVISVDLNLIFYQVLINLIFLKYNQILKIYQNWPFKKKSFDIVVVTNFLNRLIFKNIIKSQLKKMAT